MKFTRAALRLLPALAIGLGAALPVSAQAGGSVEIDGSSTVHPITSAVQSAFQSEVSEVAVTVTVSSTGGGFERFCTGETDISNASRAIKPGEIATARENGIEFIEVPIAYDGLSIVVNKGNHWFRDVTIEQLRQIFLAENQRSIKSWKDVDPSYPDILIAEYISGTQSGTFDYFREVVAGDRGSIRSDATVAEDGNQLVRGIAGNTGGIGFIGSNFYFASRQQLRAVGIVNEAGATVEPTRETVASGAYNPFSRPLFIYVNAASLDKPAVQQFVDFYLDVGPETAEEAGYVRLPDEVYDTAREKVANRTTGSVMSGTREPLTSAYVR